MEDFQTYIFEENESRTHNAKVIKERTYYIGVLIFLTGLVLVLLDFTFAWVFVLAGLATFLIGKIVMSGRDSSIGVCSFPMRITKKSLIIGEETFEWRTIEDIHINITGYRGQMFIQRTVLYKTHSGNYNVIKIRYNNLESEFLFVLESETQKNELVKFCEEHGLTVVYGVIHK